MRTTRWLPLVALAGAVILLAGCGSGDTGSGSGSDTGSGSAALTWATDADEVVVDVSRGGGYVPVEYAAGTPPEFRLYGDGTVIVPAAGEREAARIPELDTYQLSSDGVRAVLAAAAEAGLLAPELDYGQPSVTDNPTTTVTVNVNGQTFFQAAYALDFDLEGDFGVSSEQQERRRALSEFVEFVAGLPERQPDLLTTPPQAYEPAVVEAHAFESSEREHTLDWPGRAFSQEPSGSGSDCVVIRGTELAEVMQALEAAPASSPLVSPITWRSAGSRWTIGFRVVLPGERPCPRSDP
jgi:hypothetical protein